MQPTLCSRCKKNVAVIFITRIENGESHNEGLCLRCARELHIKPVDEMMEKLGISDADLDNLTGDVAEMLGSMGMLGGDADTDSDAPGTDTDEDDGKTATFPFLNRLFNQNPPSAPDAETPEQPRQDAAAADKRGSAPRKLKFLTNYCIDLTQRARDGKLDAMIGRAEELERVIQILNRRQKNNPCLIGEPGVGKTAIAEGLAQRIAEGALDQILKEIKPGVTEKEIAARLQYLMLAGGAENMSFDPIVASGPNGSMPHAVPTDRKIQEGDFVTMDFGCIYQGYCSDMTRTVAVGHVTEEMEKVYHTVLQAQLAGIAAAKAGATGHDVDAAARKVIEDAGYGPYFGHSFGHSVGVEIHEAPNATPANNNPLPLGAAVSAEPGIYLPGRFGVRIEDVLVLQEGGCMDITLAKKDLTIL